MNEVRVKKASRVFKEMSEAAQETELDKLFYDKVFVREQDKMLYYFLALPQKTVVIKTGDKQAEKDFIGYEFSSRRGHEGIRMFRDAEGKPTTKLYDNDNPLNPEKASSYVYKALLGEVPDVDVTLTDNIKIVDTVELMNFKPLSFGKSLSLNVKKKVLISSKWPLTKLEDIANIVNGGTPNTRVKEYWDGEVHWATLVDTKNKYLYKTDRTITEAGVKSSNAVLLPINTVLFSSRATIGDVTIAKVRTCTNQGYKNFICDEDKIIPEYLYYVLKSEASTIASLASGMTYKEISKQQITDYKIPLPLKAVQEKLVTEMAAIEQKEREGQVAIQMRRSKIEKVLAACSAARSIADICYISKSKLEPQNSSVQTVNYVGLENLESHSAKLTAFTPTPTANLKSTKNVFQKGDVLYGKLRPYLNKVWLAEFDGICSTDILVLQTEQPQLLKYTLLSEHFVSQSSSLMKGVNLPRLQVKEFLALKVPYPSDEELEGCLTKLSELEAEITTIEASLETIEQEKERVLKKYLE